MVSFDNFLALLAKFGLGWNRMCHHEPADLQRELNLAFQIMYWEAVGEHTYT